MYLNKNIGSLKLNKQLYLEIYQHQKYFMLCKNKILYFIYQKELELDKDVSFLFLTYDKLRL